MKQLSSTLIVLLLLLLSVKGHAQGCNISQLLQNVNELVSPQLPIVGQSFIPTCNGNVTSIQAAVVRRPNTSFVVALHDGTSTIAQEYLTSNPSGGLSWVFSSTIILLAGHEYILLIYQPGGLDWDAQISTSDPYSGGDFMHMDNGSLIKVPGTDLRFKVSITPCSGSPSITMQSLGSQTLCPDATPTDLSVTATSPAAPLSYEWFSNATNANSGGQSTGVTTNTFTPPTDNTHSGTTYYYCVVKGCGTATSNVAEVTVNAGPIWYLDNDHDGYGNPAVSQQSCNPPSGYVTDNTDCNDNDNTIHEKFGFYVDGDDDGYGTGSLVQVCAVDANTPPSGYAVEDGDCDDTDQDVNPGATEICDGKDNNCDGTVDEGFRVYVSQQPTPMQLVCENSIAADLSVGGSTNFAVSFNYQWYSNTSNSTTNSTELLGETNPTFSPPTSAVGSMYYYCVISNSCSSATSDIAEVSVAACTTWYLDNDNDGYGDATKSTQAPFQPSGYVADNTDCNDGDDTKHESFAFYIDDDHDGYGAGTGTVMVCAVDANTAPIGYSTNNTDCDDTNGSVWLTMFVYYDNDGDGYGYGSVQAVCAGNGIPAGYSYDNADCNDGNRNVHFSYDFYRDRDNDGYGAGSLESVCAVDANTPPTGYSTNNTDCNDNNGSIHAAPAAPTGTGSTPVCAGSTIALSTPAVTGATYSWTGPNGFTSTLRNPTVTGATAAAAGTYYVTYTTTGSCTSEAGSATVAVSTVTGISVASNATTYNTATGSITATASGGTGSYLYKLNSTGTYKSSEVFNNLAAGTYRIYLKDAKGCTGYTNQVTITEPAPVFTTGIIKGDVNCYGANDGTIIASVSGGAIPYQYKNGSSGVYQSDAEFDNLAPGTYRIYFKDAKGYSGYTNAVTIKQPAATLTATFTKVDATCSGSTNGAFTITAKGGTPPYSYTNQTTDNSYSSNVVSNLAPGTYPLMVSDQHGCVVYLTIVIGPDAFASTVSKTNATTYGAADGSITANLTGGTQPYQFKNGSNGSYQSSNVFSVPAGTYRIYYKDAKSCVGYTDAVTITQPNPVFTSQATGTNVSCTGANDGSITATVTGGTSPYFYKNGSTGTTYVSNNVFGNLAPGIYRIYFKDYKGFTGYTNAVTIANSSTVCGPALVSGAGTSKVKADAARGTSVEVKKNLDVVLSPNPSSTSFKLLAHGRTDKAVHVRVLDVNGRVVYTAEGAPEQAFKFGQSFISGMYMVEVRQGEEVKTVKAVKVR